MEHRWYFFQLGMKASLHRVCDHLLKEGSGISGLIMRRRMTQVAIFEETGELIEDVDILDKKGASYERKGRRICSSFRQESL